MSKGPVTPDEEKEILNSLATGKSTRQVAEEFKRAQSTISDVARRNGLDLADRSEIKKAVIARTNYASSQRIELISEALNKGRELLKTCDNPRDYQYLMIGFAIGIDKRRLEESTDPSARGGEIRLLFGKMGEEAGP